MLTQKTTNFLKRYKSEVLRTPTFDFGDQHTSQLILHSLIYASGEN
jgi:hypothetical protein